jgi:integrase
MAILPRTRKRDGKKVYDVRLFHPDDPTKEIWHTCATKKEAIAYEAAERTARSGNTWIDQRHGKKLFGDVADAWLEKNPAKRANTYATDESTVRVHLKTALPGRIGSYTKADIQRVVDTWKLTAKPRTVRRQYAVLRAIFNFAVDSEWLAKSPCRGIDLPPVTSTRRYQLSDDDVDAIACAIDPQYRPMVWIGAVLGLRWSEVAGLRVKALDFFARTITITEGGTVIRDGKGRPMVSDPKGAASAATLPVPAILMEILSEHLAAKGVNASDGDRLLFDTLEGGPLDYNHWRDRVWLPAVKAAGCQGAGFHDLRRANATALVRDKIDIRTAQSVLRHSDSRLTLNLYAQVQEEAQREATDRMASRFLRPGVSSSSQRRTSGR